MIEQARWAQDVIKKCKSLIQKNIRFTDPGLDMFFKKLNTNLDVIHLLLREGQNLSHPYFYPEYIQLEFAFVGEVEEQSHGRKINI
jgi:hypothetical protein